MTCIKTQSDGRAAYFHATVAVNHPTNWDWLLNQDWTFLIPGVEAL